LTLVDRIGSRAELERRLTLANAEQQHKLAAGLRLERYYYRPAAWARDMIDWPEGQRLTCYQEEVLSALVDHGRAAVRGPHGLGKTTGNAIGLLWFSTTRDAAGVDWKVPTTASAWRQLQQYLWPEVHKWARRLRWDRLGRPPFSPRTELLDLHLKLRHGEAFAVASNDPARIEGAHADALLYIFDEAKAIPAATFDAAEGAFSGAGSDTAHEAYALASSTPGEPNGRFHEIHKRQPGLEDWWVRHVTKAEVVAAGRMSARWAEQRARQWGRDSAVYQNRVEGEFASSDEDGVIPLAWVELANERWRRWHDAGRPASPLTHVGVDVARSGSDRTVLSFRHGPLVSELRRYGRQGTTATSGVVKGVLDVHVQAVAVVDVIGVGAGVYDELVDEVGDRAVPFNASEGTTKRDRSGELGFTNKRSAAWWNLRELLDPDGGEEVALPPDDLLTGDLTAPKWRVMAGGRLQVEGKDDIRKRLGRSTDDGDAVVQAFWDDDSRPRVLAAKRVAQRRIPEHAV
jgi:hypothetical protein